MEAGLRKRGKRRAELEGEAWLLKGHDCDDMIKSGIIRFSGIGVRIIRRTLRAWWHALELWHLVRHVG